MLAVVAATMTIVMVMGDFDLSVGSMASLAGVVAAALFTRGSASRRRSRARSLRSDSPAALINGVLVSLIGILPFIATLGDADRSSPALAFLISGGKTIFGRDIPAAFSDFARGGLPLGELGGTVLKLPYLTIVAAGGGRPRLGAPRTDHLRPAALRDRRQQRGGAARRRPGQARCGSSPSR